MTLQIIGISGKAGSGKDFIATNILKPRGYLPFSLAWAFKLQVIAEKLATREEVFVTKPPHVRQLLQRRGTELGRDVLGLDVWCILLHEWCTLLHNTWGFSKFVIPDVRLKNEVEYIQTHMQGHVYRILPSNRSDNTPLTFDQRRHISEIDLDDYHNFDGYITNEKSTSFDDLIHQINILGL